MRPEKITLNYFGPFEHETIDFTEFKDQSLFLVAGNTGAGKTTIFDAMCYALFGQTTNDQDRSAAALRSDFAPANQETWVTFIFAHQGQRYQITRRPKQELRGKKGKLITKNQQVRLIYPLDNDQPQELTKVKDVDAFICNLLNLTRDQFKQIVLLPQGKFRQFLDSNSNDKEKLLRDLFNTGLYDQWANKLKEELNTQKKGLVTQQTKLQSIMEGVPEVAADQASDQWLAAAEEYTTALSEQFTAIKHSAGQTQEKVERLNTQLHSEQALKDALTELHQLKSVAEKLDTQAGTVNKLKQQIVDLQWFQDHRGQYQRWQDQTASLVTLKTNVTALTAKIDTLAPQHQQANTELTALQEKQDAIDELKVKQDRLAKAIPAFQEADQLRERVAKLKQDVATNEQQQKEKKSTIAQLDATLASLKAQLKQGRDLNKVQINLINDQNKQDRLAQAGQEYQELLEEFRIEKERKAKLNIACQQRQAALVKAQTDFTNRNDAYARHQIAILATRLKPGSPCPVCGSLDHPHPAFNDQKENVVTEDEVKAALATLQDAQDANAKVTEQAQQSQQLFEKLNERVTNSRQALAKQMGTGALADDWGKQVEERERQLKQRHKELKAAQAKFNTQQEEASQAQERLTAGQQALQEIEQAGRSSHDELLQLKARLSEKQAALPNDFTNGQAVQDQVAEWTKAVDEFNQQLAKAQQRTQTLAEKIAGTKSKLEQVRQEWADANKTAQQLKTSLEQALAKYRSTLTWEFWQQATEKVSELNDYQSQVQDYQDQCRDNQAQQARLKKQIGDKEAPNISRTKELLADAQKELQGQQEHLGQLKRQLTQVNGTIDRVQKIIKNNDQLNQQISEMQTLTDVVTGNTETHLSLERYVLQAYFSDVLAVANDQLDRLTNGRYQFELASESHGAGAKWSGLEVNVYDDNAGKTRSARTLSGGESFMASLALALALCQIIQEQSGGISIDALFIDEGFGSLDQQTLADALHALQELEGHRMIGIISHVTELEEQVPDQLLVTSINGRSKVSYNHDVKH